MLELEPSGATVLNYEWGNCLEFVVLSHKLNRVLSHKLNRVLSHKLNCILTSRSVLLCVCVCVSSKVMQVWRLDTTLFCCLSRLFPCLPCFSV